MRIINLDETGIKIIASNKHQMYLSINDIKKFIEKKYILQENKLMFENKQLLLSKNDIKEFPNIYKYIESNFK